MKKFAIWAVAVVGALLLILAAFALYIAKVREYKFWYVFKQLITGKGLKNLPASTDQP